MSVESGFGAALKGSRGKESPESQASSNPDLLASQASVDRLSSVSDGKKVAKKSPRRQNEGSDRGLAGASSSSMPGRASVEKLVVPSVFSSTSIGLSETSEKTASTSSTNEEKSVGKERGALDTEHLTLGSVSARDLGRRAPSSLKIYSRSITTINIDRIPREVSMKPSSPNAPLRQTTSAGKLSPRQAVSLSHSKPEITEVRTALDALLANIDSLPATRERSQSDPFINSWSFHAASPVVPITHPLLKRNFLRRSRPVRQVSQIFQRVQYPTDASVSPDSIGVPTTVAPEAHRPKKKRQKSSDRSSSRDKDKKRGSSGMVESGSRETLDVPSSLSSPLNPSGRSKERSSRSKTRKSSRSTSEKSKLTDSERLSPRAHRGSGSSGGSIGGPTSSLATSLSTSSTPQLSHLNGTVSPGSISPATSPSSSPYYNPLLATTSPFGSPRMSSSILSTPKSVDSSESSDSASQGSSSEESYELLPSTYQTSSSSSASSSVPPIRTNSTKELSTSPRIKSARNVTTTVEFFVADLKSPSSRSKAPTSASGGKSPSPSRSRAKSGDTVYYTDNEGSRIRKTSKRRSGESRTTVDDVVLSRSPKSSSSLGKRRKGQDGSDGGTLVSISPLSARSPRNIPNPIWLVNKVSDADAQMFFEYLQTHFKDTQLCEAVIIMHTEIVSSRFLLDSLLHLYASTSAPPSITTSPSSTSTQGSTMDPIMTSSTGLSFSPSSDSPLDLKKTPLSYSLPARGPMQLSGANPTDSTTLKTSIINFLKKWVRLNTQDFTDDIILQEMVRDFVSDLKKRPGIECQMGGLIWDLFEASLHKLDDDPNAIPLSNDDTMLVLGRYEEEERDSPRSQGLSPRVKTPKSKPPVSVTLSIPADMVVPAYLYKFTDFPLPLLGNDAVLALSTRASIGVLDVSPHELARQWCLLDHSAFSKVRFRDFLRFASNPERCNSLAALSSSFNHGTSWVAYQILRVENPKKRARMVGHMIALAEELLGLNNFHSFLAVIIGLTQLSIGRLRATWKQVSKKELKTLQQLQQLSSPLYNFAALRNVHDSTSPPFVPLPALFLRDLVMLTEMSHEGFIDPNTSTVNVEKMLMIDKLLGRLHSAQRNHYKFVPIKSVQQVLQQGVTLTSEELEAWSVRIEPGRDL